MSAPIIFGIDLGTSNSCVAAARPDGDQTVTIPITQLAAPGAIAERPLLPSALYIPHRGEFPVGMLQLPWGDQAESGALGEFARTRGSLAPDRLITSAKSWLCHDKVDRKGPILPWNSEIAEGKRSPFEVSRLLIEHLRHSANGRRDELLGAGTSELEKSPVILTVPASFDEAARALTHEAAVSAGLESVVLLEEPLAAFYAWLSRSGDGWREHIRPGDAVLVCDVGGGTADFTLIAVTERQGDLELTRISVGEHVLLGGDNMDLALAHSARKSLESEGKSVDQWQFLSLVHACRLAKEELLSDGSPTEYPISIPGRGAGLFDSTLTTVLTKEVVDRIIVDGFLPLSAATDMPMARRGSALQQLGLPFAADAGLSRHLARFLTRSFENVRSDPALAALVSAECFAPTFFRPTKILFNGGVFKASMLRKRIIDILESWSDGRQVRELPGADYDLAVARGAAAYGRIRESGKGLRIRSGTNRSYYLGVEPTELAVPGYEPEMKGICIVQQGMEEGTSAWLEGREFGLVTGQPAHFQLFSSAVRAGDRIGTSIDGAERTLDRSTGLEVVLPSLEEGKREIVPVASSPSSTSSARWRSGFAIVVPIGVGK